MRVSEIARSSAVDAVKAFQGQGIDSYVGEQVYFSWTAPACIPHAVAVQRLERAVFEAGRAELDRLYNEFRPAVKP